MSGVYESGAFLFLFTKRTPIAVHIVARAHKSHDRPFTAVGTSARHRVPFLGIFSVYIYRSILPSLVELMVINLENYNKV